MAAHPVEEGDGAPSLRPLYMLMPYLWPKGRPDLRLRVAISLVCLVFAKVANAVVPFINGKLVDSLTHKPMLIALVIPMGFIATQTVARMLTQGIAQLRDGVFAKVQYHALRKVGVETFQHVHTLSLRFHLDRKTGGLSRVLERGTKGIDTLLSIAI